MSRTRAALFLLACTAIMAVHHATHWGWNIDDAAISYAYARNLAQGEGLVALPGGERIEGYSNPTWVLLLAFFQALGIDGFTIAQPLAFTFAVGTLVNVARIARWALPGRDDAVPWFAPLALALNAQFAIWSMSGLENALFGFLLSWGIDRLLHEVHTGARRPWSAGVFLLLAWTRPEGLMYGAIAGFWLLLATARRGLGPSLRWAAAILVPHAALIGLRIWYFAWPLPNTFYAKVGSTGSFGMVWQARGWEQLRTWSAHLWHVWYLPVYVAGLVGTRGWRGGVGLVAVGVVYGMLLVPGVEAVQGFAWWPEMKPPPTWFVARIVALGAWSVALPLVALGAPGGVARGLCAHLALASLFFAVYSNGDWMGGFRWMSLMAPTGSVMLAVGLGEVVDRLEATFGSGPPWGAVGWSAASMLLAGLIPPHATQTRNHMLYNHDETPEMVRRRASYTHSVARRTFHDEPVVNLEMDQGAHMWWYPQVREVDMAGLIDIPMSRHRYDQRWFIQEYVLEERRPTFAHVHYQWAEISGYKTYDSWHVDMVELPPYPDGGLPDHDGVWARRSLFVSPTWSGPEGRGARFAGGMELVGFDVPAPWGPGQRGFLEVGFRSLPRARGDDVQVLAVLSNGERQQTFALPLGYEGLYPVHLWRPDEVFVGRYALPVPDDFPPGTYDLAFVVLDDGGEVLPAGGWDGTLPTAGLTDAPRTARGEVRFTGVVEVTDRLQERAAAAVADAVAIAERGDCEAAEAAWTTARRVRPVDFAWHASEGVAVQGALARCWSRGAEGVPALDAAAALARAHRWDHWSPELARVGAGVGATLWEEGVAARAAGDHDRAYRAFTALLGFQPWRSWARRYAEEARDRRRSDP